MNLGQFHTRISGALKRGNSVDDIIPMWVAEAANLIETTRTWSWMMKDVTITTDPEAVNPAQISLPNNRVKSIEFLKWVQADTNDYVDLYGVDPVKLTGLSDQAYPVGYWKSGNEYLYLDSNPPEALSLWLRYSELTDWPIDDDATPALLSRGLALLSAETMLAAAAELRDPRMTEVYEARRQRAFMSLELAEQEGEYKMQGMQSQLYVPR